MRKMLVILLLLPLSFIGQYTKHYKQPKELSKGAILTIGGVAFTAAPIISELTSSNTPFRDDPNTRGIKLTPNKMAVFSGVTVTITGLITLIAEKK